VLVPTDETVQGGRCSPFSKTISLLPESSQDPKHPKTHRIAQKFDPSMVRSPQSLRKAARESVLDEPQSCRESWQELKNIDYLRGEVRKAPNGPGHV